MGGWDVYCALCGVRVVKPYWDDSGEEEEEYDPALVTQEDADWMSDTRMICENPEINSLNKVYISGECIRAEYGSLDVRPSDDPNCPSLEPGSNDYYLTAYNWQGEQPVAFPFHYVCYDAVLRPAIKHYGRTSTIDKEIFYETCKNFSDSSYPYNTCLALDYGEANDCQDQYFCASRGTEFLVCSPKTSTQITAIYHSLAQLNRGIGPAQNTWEQDSKSSDIFTGLPIEVVLQIVAFLPLRSLVNLRACSRMIRNHLLLNVFWKQRFQLDMPWLYDIPSDLWQQNIDWAEAYKIMHQSVISHKEHPYTSLYNRRRIWNTCAPLADDYLSRLQLRDSQKISSQILDEAICSATPRLIWPEPSDSTIRILPFLRDLDQDDPYDVCLNVYWNSDDHLAGFRVDHPQRSEMSVMTGNEDAFARKNSVSFDKNSWLIGIQFALQESCREKGKREESIFKCGGVGFIFRDESKNIQFGQMTGCQRLFTVAEDHLVVGLRVQWSSKHGITRLGLLQTPLKTGSWAYRDFRASHARLADSGNQAMQHLWKEALPPPGTDISAPNWGYWSSDFKSDLEPFEALIFGTSEEELASITSFSADTRFQAFELRYLDGSVKRIGNMGGAMRTLEIDSANGERFIGVKVATTYVITGFMIYTNRGQQLIIGNFYSGQMQVGQRFDPPAGRLMAGICASWRVVGTPRLETCGLLTLPGAQQYDFDHPPAVQEDELSLCWDRSRSPTTWESLGPLIGQYDRIEQPGRHDLEMPQRETVVSWLDCSKPIEKVVVVLQHDGYTPGIRLASLALVFVDGCQNVVGPDPLRMKHDMEQEQWHPYCDCYNHEIGPKPKSDEHFRQTHYAVESWNTNGSMLAQLKVWTDKWPVGIQFTTADGGQGPLWGACEGRPSSTIAFVGDMSNEADFDASTTVVSGAVGLKTFTHRADQSVTYPDPNIQGFQALVPKG